MYDPIKQFAVKTLVPLSIGGVDVSLTNSSLFMLLVALSICAGLHFLTKRLEFVPSFAQVIAESSFLFLEGLVKTYIGKEASEYIPLIVSLFFFILMSNLIGLIPHCFSVTSQLVVTFSLSISIFVFSIVVGLKKNGWKLFTLFCPKGIPIYVSPLLFVIELISFLFRPVSLGVRLFANMMAGHVVLKVVGIFATMLSGVLLPLSVIPCLANAIFSGFELATCILQAYVFALLSCIYIHDTLSLH